MMTVSISINGEPIFARTCVNVGDDDDDPRYCLYSVDDGRTIRHIRDEGAVPLAISLLKGIKEPTHGPVGTSRLPTG